MSFTDLAILNEVSEEQATHRLAACNASPRWVDEMLKRRPYGDAASLLATAEQVARSLEWSEVCRALESAMRDFDDRDPSYAANPAARRPFAQPQQNASETRA